MAKNNTTVDRIQAVWNKLGGEEGVDALLRDDLVVQPIDFNVYVDRKTTPDYSSLRGKKVSGLHMLELQHSGPEAYNLVVSIEKWNGRILHGKDLEFVYYHRRAIYIKACLNLQDALAIQAKGVTVFRKVFGLDKTVYFFGSVVVLEDGTKHVPCLHYGDGDIHLTWDNLSMSWDPSKHIMPLYRS